MQGRTKFVVAATRFDSCVMCSLSKYRCVFSICEVFKQWRDVARLAWSTRRRIHIYGREEIKSSDEHQLTAIFASKHIGHALTFFNLDYSWLGPKKEPSLAALAQHCPNLEHLDFGQVILYMCSILSTQVRKQLLMILLVYC